MEKEAIKKQMLNVINKKQVKKPDNASNWPVMTKYSLGLVSTFRYNKVIVKALLHYYYNNYYSNLNQVILL